METQLKLSRLANSLENAHFGYPLSQSVKSLVIYQRREEHKPGQLCLFTTFMRRLGYQ